MLDARPDLADDLVLDRESPLAFEMLGGVLEVAKYVLDVLVELGLVHGRRYRLRKRRTQAHRALNGIAHDGGTADAQYDAQGAGRGAGGRDLPVVILIVVMYLVLYSSSSCTHVHTLA